MADPATVAKLSELLATIKALPDPRRAMAEWKQVSKLLQKTSVPAISATNIVAGRDVVRLTQVIEQLSAAEAPPPADVPDMDTLRKAIHAFRKRLALTRLDDESRLGHSPLSKGEETSSSVTAIMPPVEWPSAVWQELVRQGRMVHVGNGLYTLPKQGPTDF